MRTVFSLLIVLFLVSTLNIPTSYAQDSPQWHLPEGVKARLGKGTIEEIAYSPDGTRLAVGGGIGIWLYDMATHQEVALLTGHTGGVLSVAYSPDGSTLASGSGNDIVRLWDAATGRLLNTIRTLSAVPIVSLLAPDGNTLASGSADKDCHVYGMSAQAPSEIHSQDTPIGAAKCCF